MTRTQEKRGVAMTYGDPEIALSPDEAVRFLENRLLLVPENPNGQGIDYGLIRNSNEHGFDDVEYNTSTKAHIFAENAVGRIQGVDGRFESITAEALLRMNKEYFGYLMDASYSQDTNAPEIVSRGIEACEGINGSTFTSTELFESGEYIVDDYQALIEHGLSVRMPNSMTKEIDNSHELAIVTIPDFAERVTQKNETVQVLDNDTMETLLKPEQMQLDFDEAVEQLSMDLDEGLEQ